MGFFNRVSAAEHNKVKTNLAAAMFDLEIAKRAKKTLEHNATLDRGVIESLTGRINDLEAEIAALKPDAEAMRAKRQRDREQKAAKAEAALNKSAIADAEAAGLFGRGKTGAATGKPRTAIPAKVGGGTAKLSGKGSAKKAVR